MVLARAGISHCLEQFAAHQDSRKLLILLPKSNSTLAHPLANTGTHHRMLIVYFPANSLFLRPLGAVLLISSS